MELHLCISYLRKSATVGHIPEPAVDRRAAQNRERCLWRGTGVCQALPVQAPRPALNAHTANLQPD